MRFRSFVSRALTRILPLSFSPLGAQNTRSYAWLELLNPAETFGDIMIDYPYVECTSASIQALRLFLRRCPGHRTAAINRAISDGAYFILKSQRPDGSWYGSWGVCFTYGAWFGILGLVSAGMTWNGTCALKRAVDFLLRRQNADGGWGESYLSCQDKVYSRLEGGRSHAVNTAWAMLALLACGQAERDAAPLHAAARCLLRLQGRDGDWPQQSVSGVFNRNCMVRGCGCVRAARGLTWCADHVRKLPERVPALGAGGVQERDAGLGGVDRDACAKSTA